MFIIVGLGNPTSKYKGTRHNAGFEVIDKLAEKHGIAVDTKKHKGLIGKGIIDGERVVLVKPMTFMNLSGECVREVMDYYRSGTDEVIIIYDDISLEPGQLRIRAKGSAGGHNGIKSIIAHLGTQEFLRVKVGVGEKPPRMDLADYVLSHFPKEEQTIMDDSYIHAADAAMHIITHGVEEAMNRYNTKRS